MLTQYEVGTGTDVREDAGTGMIGRDSQAGFTLVELLIAMAIFSSLLVIITVSFVNLMRLQTHTMATRNTQQASRYALEEMIRTARSSYAVTVPSGGTPDTAVCFWSSLGQGVTYYKGPAAGDGRLYRRPLDTPGSNACPTATSGSGERLVASSDSKVHKLRVGSTSTTPPIANITLVLAASTTDMTLVAGDDCDPTQGNNYTCSLTKLSSSVSMRGTQ